MTRQRFRRRPDQAVVAVQLKLDTDGLRFRKWGHEQVAKPGDWLVDSGSDVYTIDAESFARTYEAVGRGLYLKTAPVWAEQAVADGSVKTKEGVTVYAAGDWLVSNQPDGGDAYAVPAARFRQLYEPDPESDAPCATS
jgi:hypothetical protein